MYLCLGVRILTPRSLVTAEDDTDRWHVYGPGPPHTTCISYERIVLHLITNLCLIPFKLATQDTKIVCSI